MTAARLNPSCAAPMFAAPSPKKLTATRSSPRSLKPMAAPVAIGTLAPTMAFDGGADDRHVGQMHLSAFAAGAAGGLSPKLGGDLGRRTALGQKMPTGRCVLNITSSLRNALQTPTATASWP